MRVLISPDKFKGSMSAPQAARAIAAGVNDACAFHRAKAQIELCPLADGGDGTLEVVASVLTGTTRCEARITRPLPGHSSFATWLRWRDTNGADCALIEAAQIIGLARITTGARNPEQLSSYGLGETIRHAIHSGCSRIIIALGGSATVDAGVGCAIALGWRFLDSKDRELTTPAEFSLLAKVVPPSTENPEIVALCDVDNPLLGPRGAVYTFAPQKGATPVQCERLEAGIANVVRVCQEAGLPVAPETPGAGSAGGLGFGLNTFLGTKLTSGASYIFDAVGFDRLAESATLIITGEGRLDTQTVGGKVVAEVARRAAKKRTPVLAAVGGLEGLRENVIAALFDAGAPVADLESISGVGVTVEEAIAGGELLLRTASARLMTRYLAGR